MLTGGYLEEPMPMQYARPLRPRVMSLLCGDIPDDVRRQLMAVRSAIDNDELTECTGLDRLHYVLELWESEYLHK